MADLTYNIFSGELVVSGKDGTTVIAMAESGFSNFQTDDQRRQRRRRGQPGYQPGGPIPVGRWRVGVPGGRHPDGGRMRPNWIPVGPVRGRTHIYIHCEVHTEGCINIPKGTEGNQEKYDQIFAIVKKDSGGWLNVTAGGMG